MNKTRNLSLLLLASLISWTATSQIESLKEEEAMLKEIHEHILTQDKAYTWLTHITKKIGARLSGSSEIDQMVRYTQEELNKLGLDKVWLEPVMVPKWTRGKAEEAYIQSNGKEIPVGILALGGSIATPVSGIKAQVIEVQSLEEVEALGEAQIKGKIVFYNRSMDPKLINTFTAYGQASNQRFAGPRVAAAYGAVGVIVRSLTLRQDDVIHTGSMGYGNLPLEKYIPAATISTNTANLLSDLLKEDKNLEFYFKQNSENHAQVVSYNVIGEIRGIKYPEEILLVGGHLDSWDIGEGAHDDGAGVVQSMQVLETFKKLNYQPNRSIRVVLFANEENGLQGGRVYAANAKAKKEKHVFAIESDSGGFLPQGFSFDSEIPRSLLEKIQSWKPLFVPYNLHLFEPIGFGADIGPLKDGKVVLASLLPDSQRYFDIHHTSEDTLDKVNPRELQLGAAAMASLLYLIDQHGL